jgi:serine/threonine-protein kinase HipA
LKLSNDKSHLQEPNGKPQRIGFRYSAAYLTHQKAFALDPQYLPLTTDETIFHCEAGLPGSLDDYLPDAWGKKLLTRLAFYRDKKRLNIHSAIDILGLMGPRRIGALCICRGGETPSFELGLSIDHLADAELTAQHIDDYTFDSLSVTEMNWLYLANSGSGVGGARPKALISDNDKHYIAKFNRHQQDSFNNARVELACLRLAKKAGINVGEGKIVNEVNRRDLVLLERFDVITATELNQYNQDYRMHLISVNSLLKDANTLSDPSFNFSYDAIYSLLQQHSINIENDAEQLLKLMLFNRAINNIDDHERNFSFVNDGDGYRLSPAYDLVPTLVRGECHVAGFQYSPSPPRPSEIKRYGKVFGLSKPRVANCAEAVIDALSEWKKTADECGVNEEDSKKIESYFNL